MHVKNRYVIGDIHGRWNVLQKLLGRLDDDAEIWLVGDLVNVGPQSAEVVRWASSHPRLRCVLGNHDLHMLAVHAGAAEARKKDTFHDLLQAPDAEALIDWLRHQNMVWKDDEFMMVHAGMLPQWTPTTALNVGSEIETILRSDSWTRLFDTMYGNEPRRWSDELAGDDRLRCAINALTRTRVLSEDGAMKFKFKGEFPDIPAGQKAWFELFSPPENLTIFFGHWSALDLKVIRDREPSVPNTTIDFPAIVALDSGCAWQRKLSAICLDDGEVIQVDASDPNDDTQ